MEYGVLEDDWMLSEWREKKGWALTRVGGFFGGFFVGDDGLIGLKVDLYCHADLVIPRIGSPSCSSLVALGLSAPSVILRDRKSPMISVHSCSYEQGRIQSSMERRSLGGVVSDE
jgi:hypothetical protein